MIHLTPKQMFTLFSEVYMAGRLDGQPTYRTIYRSEISDSFLLAIEDLNINEQDKREIENLISESPEFYNP